MATGQTAAELVIDVITQANDSAAVFDEVGASAQDMSRHVTDAGEAAEASSRKLGISAEAADDLGGKAGKATGALGALSSGFELVGAEQYAGALQAAGMATDFMSGVGDSLNLVMESTAVKTALAKVQMVGHAIASGASTAATGAMTAAQWALNAAMSANPIALIVIALVALVAGLVLAYQKSETVREIVRDTGRVGREAFGWIADKVGDVVEWVGDKLPGAFNTAQTVAGVAFEVMTVGPRTLYNIVKGIVEAVRDFPGAFEAAKDKATDIKDALLAPFVAVGNAIQHILDLISKIKLPKLPNLPGLRVADDTLTAASSPPSPPPAGPTVQNVFHISGILDAEDAAVTIIGLLDQHYRLVGAP